MRNKNKKLNVIKIENGSHKEFDHKISHMNGIVLFHHPGCIHCIMLKPKWDMMKKQIDGNINIMEVNAEVLESSNSPLKNKVTGFPMIVRLNNGEITDTFKEERNIENMLKFVTKHMNNKINELNYDYNLNNKNNIKKIKISKKKQRKTGKNKKRKTGKKKQV